MQSRSPIRKTFAGLTRTLFSLTLPPATACAAAERVLKKRAAQSHLSILTSSLCTIRALWQGRKQATITRAPSLAAAAVALHLAKRDNAELRSPGTIEFDVGELPTLAAEPRQTTLYKAKEVMALAIVCRFAIEHRQYLDPDGRAIQPLPEFARDAQLLTGLYRHMVLARTFDQKMLALQRTGQLGTFASCVGKEAVDVGIASAMRPEDTLLVTYRETTAQLVRGVSMLEVLLYWGGDERGSNCATARHDFPICITIAAHCCHAVGVGYAFKLRREPRVAVCMIGDGATSKGEFYEGMNAAGAWHLPVVFVVTNNQWAISVPRKSQSAAVTLAQKAISAGIPGVQVDGNDLIAMRQAADEALERARTGGGPSLIEAVSYRLADHTTADDASRYRSADELAEAWRREPIGRFRNYLLETGAWSRQDEEALLKSCNEQVQQAAQAYLEYAPPPVTQMFDHLYAVLPAAYVPQREAAIREQQERGANHPG